MARPWPDRGKWEPEQVHLLILCLFTSAYGTGAAPLGDTHNIIVTNIISKAKHAILIGGSLCDAIISNVISGPNSEAITLAAGEENIRNVAFSNVLTSGASKSPSA